MSEHTPGPWSVIYGRRGNGPHRIEADAPASVAMVSGMGQDGAANARLIAAAPDLLKALKSVMNGEHFAMCLAGTRGYGACSQRCLELKAAIAKAENGGK